MKRNFVGIVLIFVSMMILSQKEAFATPMFGTSYYVKATSDNAYPTPYSIQTFSGGTLTDGITSVTGNANATRANTTATADLINNSLNLSFYGNSLPVYYPQFNITDYLTSGNIASAEMFDTLTFHNLSLLKSDTVTIDLNFNYSMSAGKNASASGNVSLENPNCGFNCGSKQDSFGGKSNSSVSGTGILSFNTSVNELYPTVQYVAQISGGGVSGWSTDSGFIDPSITVIAPAGVTFTSASGATYSGTPLAATPEPSTLALFGSGVVLMGLMAARKRKGPLNQA